MKTKTFALGLKTLLRESAIFAALSACVLFVSVALTRLASAANIATSSAYCGSAQTTLLAGGDFAGVIKFIVCFLEQSIVPFLFAIAVVVFFWGMIKFIAAGDAHEKEQGQDFMLWGVIAIAVMFCVWGLVNLFGQTFLSSAGQNVIPQLPVN